MDYLVYVEFNAENLQFYLWFKDYTKRFNALPESERALSKEYIPDTKEAPDLSKDPEKPEPKKSTRKASVANIMEKGYAIKEAAMFSEDEVTLGARSPGTPSLAGSTALSNADVAAQSGMKWQPCTHSSSILWHRD